MQNNETSCIKCSSQEFNAECPLCEAVRLVLEEHTVDDRIIATVMTEAAIKSIKEKVQRRTRRPVKPRQPNPALQTAVQPVAVDDPVNQGRGGKYASGMPAKEKQNEDQRNEYKKRTLKRMIGEQFVQQYKAIMENLKDSRVSSLLSEICMTGQGHANSDVMDKVSKTIDGLSNAKISDGVIIQGDIVMNWNQENANVWRRKI